MDAIGKETFRHSYGVVRTAEQQRRRQVPVIATVHSRSVFNIGIILKKALKAR